MMKTTGSTGVLALLGGVPVRPSPYPTHTTIIDNAEEQAVIEVLRGGHLSGFSGRPGERFLGGLKVRELEDAFADWFGVRHAVSFNSATSALHASLAACRIGPGDEVITSPYTMTATSASVIMQNAVPVFADIEEQTYGLDPASVQACLTERTKAILTVNIYGHPSRLDELEEIANGHGVPLIEDNAQAPGARYRGRLAGTIGRIGIQSLNYHKTIQTGEGGLALTDDVKLAEHMQLVRNHGEAVVGKTGREDIVNVLGWNYRLTELQAAIGIPQLDKLERFNKIRQRLAGKLTEGLRSFDFITLPAVERDCTHVYYLYPFRFHEERAGIPRSLFAEAMAAEGVAILEGYPEPVYLQPMYQQKIAYGTMGCPFSCPYYGQSRDYPKDLCPNAERIWEQEILTTDICKYPNGDPEVTEFIEAVDKVATSFDALRRR